MSKDKNRVSAGSIFLGFMSVASLGIAGAGLFTHQDTAAVLGFAFFGMVLAVIAGFAPRIAGSIELGKDGAKIPIAELRRAELQLIEGRLIGVDRLPDVVGKIEAALIADEGLDSRSAAAPHERGAGRGPGRTVVLTEDAAISMAKLSRDEWDLVQSELSQMSDENVDPRESDRRAPGTADAERPYFIRRVGQDIDLWYRVLDARVNQADARVNQADALDQTEALAVMAVVGRSAALTD